MLPTSLRQRLARATPWLWLATACAFGLLQAGCASQVAAPQAAAPTNAVAPAWLMACAQHAAVAQRRTYGSAFMGLQLNTGQLSAAKLQQPIGAQPVGAALDGTGTWFGRPAGTLGEYRQIRFHCLFNPSGQVVYTFVRAQ